MPQGAKHLGVLSITQFQKNTGCLVEVQLSPQNQMRAEFIEFTTKNNQVQL